MYYYRKMPVIGCRVEKQPAEQSVQHLCNNTVFLGMCGFANAQGKNPEEQITPVSGEWDWERSENTFPLYIPTFFFFFFCKMSV